MSLRYKITKAYLNRAEQKFSLKDIQKTRRQFEALSTPKLKLPIKQVQDTITDAGIKLRYYRDSKTTNKLPTVVYFHGGGFALGSINSHDSVCRYIARFARCIVLSVEYSLAPEATYPTAVDEGLSVMKWVTRSKHFYDVDTSNIFLAGDSAGGNVALHVAVRFDNKKHAKGIVLIYPTLDNTLSTNSMKQYATGYFLTKEMLAEFWSLYVGNDTTYLPPKISELKELPPVLVISAEKDVLKDEGSMFVNTLRSLGKTVEYHCYENTLHGFTQFPRLFSKKAKAFNQIARFVTKNATP